MTTWVAAWLRRGIVIAPLRPPGARPEPEFLALCIRCDRCVEICPYRSLAPGDLAPLVGAGAPHIEARAQPCYLCMLCPKACPTGALEPLADARRVHIGRAVVDPATCYAFQAILCRTCVDECPYQGDAIRQDEELRPRVLDACVGCGICEHRCPAPEPAIRVVAHGNER